MNTNREEYERVSRFESRCPDLYLVSSSEQPRFTPRVRLSFFLALCSFMNEK